MLRNGGDPGSGVPTALVQYRWDCFVFKSCAVQISACFPLTETSMFFKCFGLNLMILLSNRLVYKFPLTRIHRQTSFSASALHVPVSRPSVGTCSYHISYTRRRTPLLSSSRSFSGITAILFSYFVSPLRTLVTNNRRTYAGFMIGMMCWRMR
jgi:hypothetical protein